MILRAIALAGGIAGAAVTSQFPEFSQQYLQRLGGAVDALTQVVADFDASAAAAGLTRGEALAELQGSDFLDRRRADMARTFARHAALKADLAALEGTGPFMRAYHLPHFSDAEIARAAWQVYKPAVPLNFAGAIFAFAGFLAGAIGIGVLLRLVAWPLRLLGLRAA